MGSRHALPGPAAVKTRTNAGDMDALRSLLRQYMAEDEAMQPLLPSQEQAAAPALRVVEIAVPTPDRRPVPRPTPERALLVADAAPLPDDPSSSLRLVENAAARIREYEQRFRDIEIDARAFVSRIDAEQERLMAYVATLEGEVDAAEDRGRRAEIALDEARLQAWEERLMRRHAETRAADAEAEAEKCQAYLRRVYDILDRLNLLEGLAITRPD